MRRAWFAIQQFDEETGTWKHIGIHQDNLKDAKAELARIKKMFRKKKPILRIEQQFQKERR